MKIIFATGNQGKLREVRAIVADLGIEVESMKDAGIDVDIVEDGKTFAENALIKARTVCKACGEVTMSDDSGLEIDALGGEPGIYSARYMGEDTSYHIKNMNLVERLEGVPDEKRTARFVCAVSAVFFGGDHLVTKKTMEGRIGYEIEGENGFGYDPIFIPDGFDVTSATISPEEKNEISHRGKALRSMLEMVKERSKGNS